MLSILLLAQFISWFPWQFYTIFSESAPVEEDLGSTVSYHLHKFVLFKLFQSLHQYVEVISPIMFYIKFYFVFTGSMLNPIRESLLIPCARQ